MRDKINIQAENIFTAIPQDLDAEVVDLLAQGKYVKVERIISRGQSSPESGWYDQPQNEWMIVLKGEAILSFERDGDIEPRKRSCHLLQLPKALHLKAFLEH